MQESTLHGITMSGTSIRPAASSWMGTFTRVLLKYGNPCPRKPQLSPHKHSEVIYGVKEQLTPEDYTSLPLDNQGTKHIQGIVGALLYYDQTVDNKLLVGISDIGS